MKDLFKSFSAERDPTGTLTVEFRSAIGIELIAFSLGLFVATIAYAIQESHPWPLPIVAATMLVLVGLGIKIMFWQRSTSRVRVSVDRARSLVLIDSHSGRVELAIRDIEKAVFGSTPGARGTTNYRLEFLMRDREQTPSTSAYCIVNQRDRDSVLAALNNEIIGRSAMLS